MVVFPTAEILRAGPALRRHRTIRPKTGFADVIMRKPGRSRWKLNSIVSNIQDCQQAVLETCDNLWVLAFIIHSNRPEWVNVFSVRIFATGLKGLQVPFPLAMSGHSRVFEDVGLRRTGPIHGNASVDLSLSIANALGLTRSASFRG